MLLLLFMLCMTSSHTMALQCDLGGSDVIFLVKAGFTVTKEDFEETKQFIQLMSHSLDIGRHEQNTRVGVVLYDNISPPSYRIPLQAYGRESDVTIAIGKLERIACGYAWCKEKTDNSKENRVLFVMFPFPAVDHAISLFPSSSRMKKLVLLSSAQSATPLSDAYYHLKEKTSQDPLLKAVEIVIGNAGIVTSDNALYNYYLAYNDPYKRYMSRMAQLYPNYTLTLPPQPSLPRTATQIVDGRITVADSEDLVSIRHSVCDQLFACPPCQGAGLHRGQGQTSEGPKGPAIPGEKTLPPSFFQESGSISEGSSPSAKPTAKPSSSPGSEEYDYEIVGDPPGLKINKNPAKGARKLADEPAIGVSRTTTPLPSEEVVDHPEYEYEDGKGPNSSEPPTRKKRSTARRIRDCTCPSTPSIDFSVDESLNERESSQTFSAAPAPAPAYTSYPSQPYPAYPSYPSYPQYASYPAYRYPQQHYQRQYPCAAAYPCRRPCGSCGYAQTVMQNYGPTQEYTYGNYVEETHQPASLAVNDGSTQVQEVTAKKKEIKQEKKPVVEVIKLPEPKGEPQQQQVEGAEKIMEEYRAKRFREQDAVMKTWRRISADHPTAPAPLPPIDRLLSLFDPSKSLFSSFDTTREKFIQKIKERVFEKEDTGVAVPPRDPFQAEGDQFEMKLPDSGSSLGTLEQRKRAKLLI